MESHSQKHLLVGVNTYTKYIVLHDSEPRGVAVTPLTGNMTGKDQLLLLEMSLQDINMESSRAGKADAQCCAQ